MITTSPLHIVRDFDGVVLAQHERKGRWAHPDGTWSKDGEIDPCELPLYGSEKLADLPDADTVVIVEGEKAADALRARGYNVLGTYGKNVTPIDDVLRPLVRFRVLLWPDNDADGGGPEHMEKIARALHRLGHRDVRLVEWADAPDKGDAADFADDDDALRVLLDAAEPMMPKTPPAPATPTTAALWPADQPDAFYGLLGDVVRVIGPHTEGDPYGILLGLLAGFGNAAGDGPYFVVGADRHTPRIFALTAGETAKSRKGSAWSIVEAILRAADPEWGDLHIVSGLSSGEGLIHGVRDPVTKHEPIKEKGHVVGYQDVEIDPGISDKRLLVIEPEFGRVLKVASREGNIVSPVLRQAWDSGNLRVMTKTPAKATGAHISMLGQITKDELLRELSSTDQVNGFANRFVIMMVRRSQLLPDGGAVPPGQFVDLVERLREALEFASTTGQMVRDAEARERWHEIYPELSGDRPGLFGSVTARAEAQVLRLSMIYALADLHQTIGRQHLDAAYALWKRAEASVKFLFGDATGDTVTDTIVKALREQGEMSGTAIYNLFGRHTRAERITAALNSLLAAGRVQSWTVETGGRPVTMWKVTA